MKEIKLSQIKNLSAFAEIVEMLGGKLSNAHPSETLIYKDGKAIYRITHKGASSVHYLHWCAIVNS